jgi:hypothetical protein
MIVRIADRPHIGCHERVSLSAADPETKIVSLRRWSHWSTEFHRLVSSGQRPISFSGSPL